ncbi:phage baseplate assembly protein V [Terriglobus roseus]|uniref:Gp5/Type VI secretion system Vgr protein OB-fold domain-containing protein n=1 Tax=Terriglobus roseus TaxID=392734 RepID=A0A1G7J8R7_9BACT|nr:phage baseplate assembly protein V [Terriglobus roseus]SDF21320.1 hypothetical protein SAMN05444167_1729 [Terriglobus roseus]
MAKFFGKYRGTVLANVDPMQMGRLLVQVAGVAGALPSTWAMPCLPFTGIQSGMYVVPEIQSGVWIEFEAGDPDYPIWVGGFWGSSAELPALALAGTPGLQQLVIQTTSQNTLMISDTPGPTGGILLKTTAGAMIAINETGITITNGQGATIMMTGPSVTINEGALQVV